MLNKKRILVIVLRAAFFCLALAGIAILDLFFNPYIAHMSFDWWNSHYATWLFLFDRWRWFIATAIESIVASILYEYLNS